MPGKALLRLIPALALGVALGGACTADVEEEGELPEVNVEGGEAPAVDVDPADVDVTADTQQVVVPDVDVNAPADTAR
jgi:hypothetical protein